MREIIFVSLLMITVNAGGQTPWNNKKCAVVLTYDDAIDAHLDHALPVLDSLGLKGTFYLIGASPVTDLRMKEWIAAARNGHELGNHSLCHPCDGNKPGRTFVTVDTDLSKYTPARAVKEIRLNNSLLKAMDGKTKRTFAYPFGDRKIGEVFFYNELVNDFSGARGVIGAMNVLDSVKLDNIDSYMINGHSGEYMIDLVRKSMERNALLVFMFHGVGGGHSINVGLKEHSQLLHYLKQHEKEIWIAPMVEVAEFVKSTKAKSVKK